MDIFGVLLGITITVLAGAIYFVRSERNRMDAVIQHALGQVSHLRESVTRLEARKTYSAETYESKPEDKRGKVSMRTWNENIGAVESK